MMIMEVMTPKPVHNLRLVLDTGSIEQHSNGSVTGIVFWEIDGRGFPDNAWNDFVLVVIAWWLKAVIRLLTGTSEAERMEFMDGPYCILCNTAGTSVVCKFIDRRENNYVVASWTCPMEHLAQEIYRAGEAALETCGSMGISSTDLGVLHRELRLLNELE
jgi:hypothetical protein